MGDYYCKIGNTALVSLPDAAKWWKGKGSRKATDKEWVGLHMYPKKPLAMIA